MVFTTEGFFWSSYRKFAWVRFEPASTGFRSDALSDWAIRPWLQLELRVIFVQLLYRFFSVTFFSDIYIYYICWFSKLYGLINCSQFSVNSTNFFLTCMETEARFIFEGFNIVLYGKFISYSLILFHFFMWSANCSTDFFSPYFSQ